MNGAKDLLDNFKRGGRFINTSVYHVRVKMEILSQSR